MNQKDKIYLWKLIHLACFSGDGAGAKEYASKVYEESESLPLAVVAEVMEFSVNESLESLYSLIEMAIDKSFFEMKEHLAAVSLFVELERFDPLAALQHVSIKGSSNTDSIERSCFDQLLDAAWHIRQDEEFGFDGENNLDEILVAWHSVFLWAKNQEPI